MVERYLDTVEGPGSIPGATTNPDPEYLPKEVSSNTIISILEACLFKPTSMHSSDCDPNGVVVAEVGSLCVQSDSTLWVCTGFQAWSRIDSGA